MKKDFAPLLLGRDLRSIARSNEVVRFVDDQETFDQLFNLLLHHERLLVMRAADALEKVTLKHQAFLEPHKNQLLSLLKSAFHKELKWHIALLVTRVTLTSDELREVWDMLTYWAKNPNESKIVRVNSLQGLFELYRKYPHLEDSFTHTLQVLEHDQIPSIQMRIKKLRQVKK
ncbi:MAG: hypothetical protein WD824_08945 [Cyclobacteriaceae bacterium]